MCEVVFVLVLGRNRMVNYMLAGFWCFYCVLCMCMRRENDACVFVS